MASAILAIGILVFLAHFFTALFQRTRLPDVLLLMVLGVLLGPVLHLVTPEDFGKVGNVMSTLALIVILFESGIALEPGTFRRSIRPTVLLTVPTFIVTILITYFFAAFVLGFSQGVAWITGAILAGVSAAVVIPMVKSMKVNGPLSTSLVMESALGDVLSIVVLLALIQAVSSGDLNPARMVGTVMASLLMAALIGFFGGVAWLLVLNQVRQLPHTAFTTLAVVFILYGVADELGFSGAIASLAFGATLTNYERLLLTNFDIFKVRGLGRIAEQDVSFFMEILFLLKTFFFVYLGASIRFQEASLALWALALSGGIYLARLLIVRFLVRVPGVTWRDLAVASVMVPKGLVAAVLAGVALEAGVEGAERVRDFVYMVVFVSIVITAMAVPLIERKPLSGMLRWFFGHEYAAMEEAKPVEAST